MIESKPWTPGLVVDPDAPFALIPFDAFDTRRADVLCTYCAKPVGLRTTLVNTESGRWAHATCRELITGEPVCPT